jgi:3'(2'), 5'-bisphosphate nucleotidase
MSIDYIKLIEIAKTAAEEAGKAIMDIYNNNDFEVELKDNSSPLTKADKSGHEILLRLLRPVGFPVLSEEGKAIPYEERSKWNYYWLIDPLDGTKEFIKRNGEFTVNIALIHNGEPILGVVFAPVLGVLYWGGRGNGAYRQEWNKAAEPMVISQQNEVKCIVASRSHMSAETETFIQMYPGASLISMGSSLKFMLVAEGRAQIYPRFAPTMEWDTAAAQAIVVAAGGKVLNYPELSMLTYNRQNMLNGWFLCS